MPGCAVAFLKGDRESGGALFWGVGTDDGHDEDEETDRTTEREGGSFEK